MDMDFVFRIAGIGILPSVIGIVLTRAGREDVAMLTTLSGLVVVLLMVVNMLAGFFDSVRAVFQLSWWRRGASPFCWGRRGSPARPCARRGRNWRRAWRWRRARRR